MSDFWVQERFKNGDLHLGKIASTAIPADLLTQSVDAKTLERSIPLAGLDWETSRPELAPSLTRALMPRFKIGHGLYAICTGLILQHIH